MPSSLNTTKYRADIDGLRAVAVILVVAFHAYPEIIPGGFIGVDVFFVISGFLITSIILDELESGIFTLRGFYARRIKRIFPALVLLLALVYLLGWIVLLPKEYQHLGKHISASAAFINNLVSIGELGYFDKDADSKPLLHLWSLGVEEQFYIVWPLILLFCFSRNIGISGVILIITIVSFFINILLVQLDASRAFFSPQARMWEFLVGCSIAAFRSSSLKSKIELSIRDIISDLQSGRSKSKFRNFALLDRDLLSTVGAVTLIVGVFVVSNNKDFAGLWALSPVLGSLFIITAGSAAWFNRIILENKVLVWVGLISFPLYLWHWMMLSFVRILADGNPSQEILNIAVLLSVIFSWITYRFVEVPVRKTEYSKGLVSVLVFIMLALGLLGLVTSGNEGFEFRFKEHRALHELVSNPFPKVNDIDCAAHIPMLADVKFDAGCRMSGNEAPRIAFVGDSHVSHYRNAVWGQIKEPVVMIVETSCLPFSSVYFMKGECKKKYELVLKYLESDKNIKTVVLSGYWAYLLGGGASRAGKNWRQAKPLTEVGVKTFINNAREFISRLQKNGKRVILFKDIPDLDFNIDTCFNVRPFSLVPVSNKRSDCYISENEFLARMEPYDQIIELIQKEFPLLQIYDPRPIFCKAGICRALDDGLPLYFNGDHVNRLGAQYMIADMIEKLKLSP